MFLNTFQTGLISLFYSIGSKIELFLLFNFFSSDQLEIWDKYATTGRIRYVKDETILSNVLEVVGTNLSKVYITCPIDTYKSLGITLPYFSIILKNLNKFCSFEIHIKDDKGKLRIFRASNFQSTTRVKPLICTMPLRLASGWNKISMNLKEFNKRAYGTNYIETIKIYIHANCRVRRIYFSDRLYSENELPNSFKLFLPNKNI